MKDQIIDSIGKIDDDMIESVDSIRQKKRAKPVWVKWSAIAACLCLAAIGAIVAVSNRNASVNNDPSQTDIGHQLAPYNLSASDVAALFPAAADRETNQYTVVYASSIDELCGFMSDTSDTIDIYTMKSEAPDPDKARTFFEAHLPFWQSLSSVSSMDYDWLETTDAYGNPIIYCQLSEEHLPEDGEGDEAWTFSYINLTAARNQYIVSTSKTTPLTVNDAYVGFPADVTDEEIKNLLTDIVRYLNESLDTDYSEMKVSRSFRYDGLKSVSVFIYDGTTSAYPDLFRQQPLSDGCITLTFYSDWGEGSAHDWSQFTEDELLLGEVSFYVSDDPWDDVYTVLGTNRMLSLEEAEEMLAMGYVFGGHSCPLCMEEQEALNFTDYDGVEIEYVHSMDSLIYIPFYAFYKEIGMNEYGMPSFAKTYVCAVEVSGLDDYFDGQETYH